MRRYAVLLNLICILLMFFLGSQVWASAIVSESMIAVQISGLEAFPQLSVILVACLLIVFISRYTKSLFGRFILSAVLILLFATATPVWFESAAGSLAILGPQIGALTGVGDWTAQQVLISSASFNHLFADIFIIALIVSLGLSLYSIWTSAPGGPGKNLTTRIDRLPQW
jgi:hypothetical protein